MPKEGSHSAASPVKETLLWTAPSQSKATFLRLVHHDANIIRNLTNDA